jgi:hypothetical protein
LKDEFLRKVENLQKSLVELEEVWSKVDWSRVPAQVAEHYPFHSDLNEMIMAVEKWTDMIKTS